MANPPDSESLELSSLPSWVPDWLPATRPEPVFLVNPSAPTLNEGSSVHQVTSTLNEGSSVHQVTSTLNEGSSVVQATSTSGGFELRQKLVVVTPSRDRTVNRKLRGIHLFMITVNATLGTGLYWRGGQVLELGGPLSVVLSFLLVGFISWAVMQCITEMLCIWPIPGSFSVYVSEFVDPELGIAVGVAYWYTYSISFSALVTTTAAYIRFWMSENDAFYAGIVYFFIPLSLIAANGVGVQLYGRIEVFAGAIKISFLAAVICILFVITFIKSSGEDGKPKGVQFWDKPTDYDQNAAQSWFVSLCMSLSIAAFAYTGVEIVAASALEVKWPNKDSKDSRTPTDFSQRSIESLLVGKTVKFSSVYISVLATVAYILAGTLATFNMQRSDCSLPRLSWVISPKCYGSSHQKESEGDTKSVFVSIAIQSGIPHLAHAFNAFIIFTAVTCANTNLYVASRAFFGLTTRLDGGPGQLWFLRILAWFGRTNRFKVPLRAMILSALAFCWVPFLQLRGGFGIGMFIEVLASMGSVSVIIVWACQCWAFIRYYRCIYRHRRVLEEQKVPQVRRWNHDGDDDYPYRSHAQPFLGYVALFGCLFIILVSSSANLWNGFYPMPFLGSFLIIFAFLGIWIVLKIIRGAKWSLVDLDTAEKVVNKIRNLHDIRVGAL